MARLRFYDWWEKYDNKQDFWRISNGVAVSLGETPRSIFRQILQRLKEYHDQNVGYGNLLDGVRIGENEQVKLKDYGHNPKRRRLAEPSAAIKEDFLDFEELVTRVEKLIYQVKPVRPAYSSKKFHELCRMLDPGNHYRTVDELRRFGFYMRNNPLFWNEADKFLFFRKVLTIKEFDDKFSTSVTLRGIQGWSQDVRHNRLKAVKFFCPENHRKYETPVGSIDFYRNCLGHVRDPRRRHIDGRIYHDAKILHVLEDDLPQVIPVWFYELVRQLDLNKQKCSSMCDFSWMEFLSKQPSVFT